LIVKATGGPNMNEAEEQIHRSSSSGGTLAWFLLAAPLLYILSIGPVAAIWVKTQSRVAPLETFYAPVIWLHDHTPLKEPLEWYVELWGVK
jgi:hypothetical protein